MVEQDISLFRLRESIHSYELNVGLKSQFLT